MPGVLKDRCLVLNKSCQAIKTVSVETAVKTLFKTYLNGEPKARIVCHETFSHMTWDDWSKIKPKEGESVLRTTRDMIRVPQIIVLTRYDKIPKRKSSFNRKGLYKRDHYKCQYCGCEPGSAELTIDHVVPRSKGGHSTWTNCVLACVSCNARKADRTPEEARMRLLKTPKEPNASFFEEFRPKESWKVFIPSNDFSSLIDTAYWNVELED